MYFRNMLWAHYSWVMNKSFPKKSVIVNYVLSSKYATVEYVFPRNMTSMLTSDLWPLESSPSRRGWDGWPYVRPGQQAQADGPGSQPQQRGSVPVFRTSRSRTRSQEYSNGKRTQGNLDKICSFICTQTPCIQIHFYSSNFHFDIDTCHIICRYI